MPIWRVELMWAARIVCILKAAKNACASVIKFLPKSVVKFLPRNVVNFLPKAIVKSKKMLYNRLDYAFSGLDGSFFDEMKGETDDRRYKLL